jgi:uncharacterized protein (TIGR03382 family)
MKKALMILSSLLVAVGAFAQGQVNFATKGPDYNAPVFVGSVAGGVKADGPAYMVQLYAGATQTALTAVGSPLPFRTGAAAGNWFATAVTINSVDAVSKAAFVQVRAWATASGATYEAALASGTGFGTGNITSVTPTVAPAVPADLTGLQSFAISGTAPIPEPSIMALGALGGLALLLRRRK